MKKILFLMVIGVLALVNSGCSVLQRSVREDITDFTKKDIYKETAREFLSDEVLLGMTKVPDSSKTQEYCKGMSNETSQKFQEKVFKVASIMDKFGFSGMSGRNGLVSKPTMDFNEKYRLCNNFLAFAGGLTPDERRKFLLFLGKDYFSVNWMQEKFTEGDYPTSMRISTKANEMVQDKGYNASADSVPSDAGLQSYLQKRIDWQSRNSGIAMLGWLKKADKDKELGLVNPASMEELKRKYSLYRNDGFSWYTTDKMELKTKGIQKNLMTFIPDRAETGTNQLIDVWGAIEKISVNDPIERLKPFFEKFRPSTVVDGFFSELGKKDPDLSKVKNIAVESVSDEELKKAKDYAQWLANGKQQGGVAGDGK